jgi:hypothetical protein
MSGSQVEIEAVCEVHPGSGRLVISRKSDRIVLNSRADDCCVLTLEGPAVTLLFDVLGQWAGVSALARWVISPTDGRAHSLPVDGHPPGALRTRCGHWLSLCVVQHDHLPGRQWCVPCMVAHLLPAPVFGHEIPAGRRSSPAPPLRAPVASRFQMPPRSRCWITASMGKGKEAEDG